MRRRAPDQTSSRYQSTSVFRRRAEAHDEKDRRWTALSSRSCNGVGAAYSVGHATTSRGATRALMTLSSLFGRTTPGSPSRERSYLNRQVLWPLLSSQMKSVGQSRSSVHPKKHRVPLWSMQKKPAGHSLSSLHVGLHHPWAEHLPPVQHEPAAPPHSASLEHVAPYEVPAEGVTGRAPPVEVPLLDDPGLSSLPHAINAPAATVTTSAHDDSTLRKRTSEACRM